MSALRRIVLAGYILGFYLTWVIAFDEGESKHLQRHVHKQPQNYRWQHEDIGVSFVREISEFPTNAKAIVNLEPSSACKNQDQFGVNTCHFQWGTDIKGNYSFKFEEPIHAADYLEGKFKFDSFLPYHFKCALCGEDCILQIPVIHANITIPMDKSCPITFNKTKIVGIDEHLWKKSPSNGIVKTKMEGTVTLIQGSTGNSLVEFKLTSIIR